MMPRSMSDRKKRPNPKSKPRATPSASPDKDKKDKKDKPRARKALPKSQVARGTKKTRTTDPGPGAVEV